MNLVKEMNKCENKFLTKILDKYIDIGDSVYQKYIRDIEREFKEMYLILNSNHNNYAFEYVRYRFFRDIDKMKYFSSLVREEITRRSTEARGFYVEYQEEMQVLYNNRRDYEIVKKKLNLTIHKSYKLQDDILHDMMANTYFLVDEVIGKLQEYKPEEYISYEKPQEDEDISIEIKNIFSHRGMEELAMENGYKYERCTGDHLIYKHGTSNRIVVIPRHTSLGKGLSINIQKQIYSRKGA